MEKELIREKADSIKISRSVKGIYTWEIKRYYEYEGAAGQVVDELVKIDNELKLKFGDPNENK